MLYTPPLGFSEAGRSAYHSSSAAACPLPPPSFIYFYDSIRDGLKAFPVKANPEHTVSICHPSGGSHLRYVLDAAVSIEERSHNFSCNGCGTLQIVTGILLSSGCNRKNFVEIQVSACFAACSFVGSSTSHAVKLLLQKYYLLCEGAPQKCPS